MKLVLVGAGQRGMIYAQYAKDSGRASITAVVEPDEVRRASAGKRLEIDPIHLYENVEDFFKAEKKADAIIIASMDRNHYKHAMVALDHGYDILLEKPISPDLKETIGIQQKANKLGKKIIVCHVLRYTNFYSELKRIIDSKELGKVITIQHNENVGNFHIAHSFVRGNWRKEAESSPIVMQKSSHDMDILTWLVGSDAKRISSFGSLTYFKEENAPTGSASRCLDCTVADTCRFDAKKAYLPVRGSWPATLLGEDQSEEGILKALETSPYGKCVYRCDNDVCDNQVMLIEFKNGVTVSFNLSGFTNKMNRTFKIMCEDGEIRGDDSQNVIEIIRFGSNMVDKVEMKVIHPEVTQGFHGGGDIGLMKDFLSQMESGDITSRSSIDKSVQSHLMATAAEHARVTGKTVDLDLFREEILQVTD